MNGRWNISVWSFLWQLIVDIKKRKMSQKKFKNHFKVFSWGEKIIGVNLFNPNFRITSRTIGAYITVLLSVVCTIYSIFSGYSDFKLFTKMVMTAADVLQVIFCLENFVAFINSLFHRVLSSFSNALRLSKNSP